MKCPICLIPFADLKEAKKRTFCGHEFCGTCLDEWEKAHITCPMCRSNLVEGKLKAIKQRARAMFPEEIRIYIRSSRTIQLAPGAPRCDFFCVIFWQPSIKTIPETWVKYYRKTYRNDMVELLTTGREGIIVSYDLKPPKGISFCHLCNFITTDPWKLQRHRREEFCDYLNDC